MTKELAEEIERRVRAKNILDQMNDGQIKRFLSWVQSPDKKALAEIKHRMQFLEIED